MSVCILLTGRAGSSLKDKSFMEVDNVQCIDRIIQECLTTTEVKHFFCSSDCHRILNHTKTLNFLPILRPAILGSDHAQHKDVIQHALSTIKDDYKINPSILIVVLANNPIIFSDWLSTSIKLISEDPSITSVVPVYEYSDHSPFRSKVISAEGYLKIPEYLSSLQSVSSNRQALPKTYFLCHNFWALNLNLFDAKFKDDGDPPWGFMGLRSKSLIVPKSHDIHTLDDVSICENILKWYNEDLSRKGSFLKSD